MTSRWTEKLTTILPQKDQAQLQISSTDAKTQTAPEYSQVVYLSMLTKEQAVGDYLQDEAQSRSLGIKTVDRETMIALIQELHRVKRYKIETPFLACSIVDRFLQKLSV